MMNDSKPDDRALGVLPAPDNVPERLEEDPTESNLPMLVMLALGAVFVAGLVLRFTVRSDLWLDEALSVNIARLPLEQLHDALRHDGAPPLYYVLLHRWIDVFGSGDGAVRSFSAVCEIATVPLVWAAGKRLGGRRMAATCFIVFWTAPFAFRFATETRMYSLVMLLVFAAYLALLRVLERPSAGRIATLGVLGAALLYTQYWSLYLAAVVGLGLAYAWWRAGRAGSDGAEGADVPEGLGGVGLQRRAVTGAIVAFAAAFISWIPWIPTFLDQLRETGTPWGSAVTPVTALGGTIFAFAGGEHAEGVAFVAPLVLLALLGVFGRAIDTSRIEIDLRTRPGVRIEALAACATMLVGTGLSWVNGTAFQARYAAVVFPLFVLVVGWGFTSISSQRLWVAVAVFVVAMGFVSAVRNAREHRTQAAQVASFINHKADGAKSGDVVAYCPDQLGPAVSRLIDSDRGLAQGVFPTGKRPELIDWIDYEDRNARADPVGFAEAVIAQAGDHDIWLVWAPGYKTYGTMCQALDAALRAKRPTAEALVQPDATFFEFQGLIRYRAS